MRKDLSKMPVQPTPCRSCPFEGEEPIDLEPEDRARYIAKIINLKSQHLCHSAQNNKMLCRGGRNIMLRVMCGYGLIAEPTDAAYEEAISEMIGESEV